MLTALVLSMAVAAPVPPPAAPVPSGPAPRVLELKPGTDGKLTVMVTRTEMQKVTVTVLNPNGVPATEEREVSVPKVVIVELADVKELKVTTADGKKVDVADAIKQLKGGGVVVMSSDGKPVSPNFLRAFKDNVLVLTAPELAPPAPMANPWAKPPVRPLPAPVQIQIAPAVPAVPAVPPAPPK